MNSVKKVVQGGWTVEVLVDEDGDLNIWVSAGDLRVVEDDADIADDDRKWAERFHAVLDRVPQSTSTQEKTS